MTVWVVPTEASKARVPQAKQRIDSPLAVCHLNSANPNPMSDAPHQAGKLALNEPVECDCNLGSRNSRAQDHTAPNKTARVQCRHAKKQGDHACFVCPVSEGTTKRNAPCLGGHDHKDTPRSGVDQHDTSAKQSTQRPSRLSEGDDNHESTESSAQTSEQRPSDQHHIGLLQSACEDQVPAANHAHDKLHEHDAQTSQSLYLEGQGQCPDEFEESKQIPRTTWYDEPHCTTRWRGPRGRRGSWPEAFNHQGSQIARTAGFWDRQRFKVVRHWYTWAWKGSVKCDWVKSKQHCMRRTKPSAMIPDGHDYSTADTSKCTFTNENKFQDHSWPDWTQLQ